MPASRFFIASLFIVAAFSVAGAQRVAVPATAVVQQSESQAPVVSPNVIAIPHWTLTAPGMGCDPLACVDGQHALTAPKSGDRLSPLPGLKLAQTSPGFIQLSDKQIAELKLLVLQNDMHLTAPCYTLRSYQFTPTTPGSGAGKISAESTCQPSKTIHQKTVAAQKPVMLPVAGTNK